MRLISHKEELVIVELEILDMRDFGRNTAKGFQPIGGAIDVFERCVVRYV